MSEEVSKSIASVAGTSEEAVVAVNLNGSGTVPAAAISEIAGKDVILNLTVSANTSVNINGGSLSASDVGDIKLSAGTDAAGNATLSVRSDNSNIEKSIDVFYKVGGTKVGGNAVLNFVNADGSLIEFRTSIVYDNGYAAFTTPLVSANYKMTLK
jgi:hypothetical protein